MDPGKISSYLQVFMQGGIGSNDYNLQQDEFSTIAE